MARAQGKVGFTTTRVAHGRGRSHAMLSAPGEAAASRCCCCPRDGLTLVGESQDTRR